MSPLTPRQEAEDVEAFGACRDHAQAVSVGRGRTRSTNTFLPPFAKKAAGKHYVWADDLTVAYLFGIEYGLELVRSDAAYQVAKLIGDDVKLVIYPHTTKGTGNQHLRVRDEGSKNKPRAQALMVLLDRAAGANCTFSFRWTVNALAHRWRNDADALTEIKAVALGDGASSASTTEEAQDLRRANPLEPDFRRMD